LAVGLGRSVDGFSTGQIIEAGRELLARGAALVVITLGGEGALAIAPEGCWQASAPYVPVVSTIGSGDSFLAGLAVARLEGQTLQSALALGVACGAANANTNLPGRFERDLVEALISQVSLKRLE
jgi:fructose-1-phosphate kinase PfkB-like protein